LWRRRCPIWRRKPSRSSTRRGGCLPAPGRRARRAGRKSTSGSLASRIGSAPTSSNCWNRSSARGKVRAEVSAELDRAQKREEAHVYDPDAQVISRQISVESGKQDQETAAGDGSVFGRQPAPHRRRVRRLKPRQPDPVPRQRDIRGHELRQQPHRYGDGDRAGRDQAALGRGDDRPRREKDPARRPDAEAHPAGGKCGGI
jgi:hypothetical protein